MEKLLFEKCNELREELDDYKAEDREFNYLIRALLNHSTLSYNDKFLTFEDEKVSFLLSLFKPEKYELQLRHLRKEKITKEGTENND